MSTETTDRLENRIILRVPQGRVWRAISDAQEFGTWFGIPITGTFAPGARLSGAFDYQGKRIPWVITIERMIPERLLSFRWHPYAVNPDIDYSREPTTLVTFTLEDTPRGTQLTVVESGFDKLPVSRRAEAHRMNDQGWAEQMGNLERHVGQSP